MKTILRRPLVRAALFAALLAAVVHAFCFFNLTYSGPSVMVSAGSAASAQTAAGQFAQPIYWRIRGSAASPLLVGAIACACIGLCAAAVVRLLDLRGLPAALTCAALAVNPHVTSVFASSLHTADALMLACALMCTASALAMRPPHRLCPLLAACLAAGALALDPTVFSLGAALVLMHVIACLLRGEPVRAIVRSAIVGALVLLAGAALFAAGHFVMLRRAGLSSSASLRMPRGGSLFGAWLYPAAQLFAPLTAYPPVQIAVHAALLLLALLALVLLMKRDARRGLAALLLALLMPLAVNLPVYSAAPAAQTSLSFALLDVLLVMLLSTLSLRIVKIASAALAVMTLGGVVFANQVYVKKNLEFHATLAAMTRVVARMEATTGFTPGATPTAIIGSLESGELSVQREGFERLSALEAARNNYAAVTPDDYTWYLWDIMGYPANIVGTYERDQLAAREDVAALPAFPAEGCTAMIDGTLVVKLSD